MNASRANKMAITYDEFRKVDLRVALVEDAELVPGTSKLLKLVLRVGNEKRQIVAGIADQYSAEQIKGKKIVLVANLEPRTVRGVESQGMLLAAVEPGGKLALLVPERDIGDGTQVQ